ncbi:hypothetical protein [Rhodocyclus tenuis]|uniref:Uncharacterized protein n=1 Tax=Rhodocyclus tenuis TaxID=1066 RepID=A0A840G7N8_RHOTE|nr:hypothetical protein [Rhodocyclus tenuis]MBB4248353.1 hypothetical protein [Rhodocyclus tenuis]
MKSADHLHALPMIDSAAAEQTRATSVSMATTLIMNLLRCVLFLIKNRLSVISFRGYRDIGGDNIVIVVAPSPRLHAIFGEDCAWRQRRPDGELTIYTWFADRFGCRVEWEEVTCL